jgi:sulfoxide reductase heme-binding subunit YedZ
MMDWLNEKGSRACLNVFALASMLGVLAGGFATPGFGERAGPLLASGLWAVRFLLVCLMMTPLRVYLGWNQALKLRKPAGLWSFAFAALHILLIANARDPLTLGPLRVPFIPLGLFGLGVLTLLALTSNRLAMRLLKRGWKRLHRLVYPAVLAVTGHAILAAKQSKVMAELEPERILELQVYLLLAVFVLVGRIPRVVHLLKRIPAPARVDRRDSKLDEAEIGIRPIPNQPPEPHWVPLDRDRITWRSLPVKSDVRERITPKPN